MLQRFKHSIQYFSYSYKQNFKSICFNMILSGNLHVWVKDFFTGGARKVIETCKFTNFE